MKNRYQKKLYEAEYLPDIRSLLYRGKALYPHHTVLVEIAGKDQERRLGYRELCDNAEALGTAMIAHGMKTPILPSSAKTVSIGCRRILRLFVE